MKTIVKIDKTDLAKLLYDNRDAQQSNCYIEVNEDGCLYFGQSGEYTGDGDIIVDFMHLDVDLSDIIEIENWLNDWDLSDIYNTDFIYELI